MLARRTHVVPPALWTPLPASEPAKLLSAAKACRVQRLRLSLSLCLTPDPVTHPLVRVTLECARRQTLSLFPAADFQSGRMGR